MGKRKRSGKASNATNNNANKRARILDGDSDSDGPNSAAPVKFAPGESPEEKEALLSNKALFSSDLSRADHDRERRLYKLLGSADVEDRIRAADVIVSALLGTAEDNSSDDRDESDAESKSVPEAVLLRHLERRLLRGLASGSEASRVGFSYVLSELLGQLLGRRTEGEAEGTPKKADYTSTYPNLTFDRLLDLLLDKTRPAANLPGQEERDHYWGQLFGLQSFVESGILFAASDAGRVSRWDTLLGHLLQLGHKKVWLRSQACFVVVQAIARGRLPDEATVAATLKKVASDTEGAGTSLAKTPEGLGIWLAALARFPGMALPAPWTAPLAPGSHKDVVAVLKSGSIDDNEAKGVRQGNASSQLHFVWDLLLGELLVGKDGDAAAVKRFDAFWVAVVDQVYFAKGASDHQKLTGFKVFQKALALCVATAKSPATAIRPSLFSNNLMACLMNQASNPTPRLHRAAVSVLKAIERQVEENPQILVSVLECLLGSAPLSHGTYDFDERVKGTGDGTRPVERILRLADSENIEEVIRLLRNGALQAPDPNNDQKPFRIYAGSLFRLVSRAGAEVGAASQPGDVSVGRIAFQALAELAFPSATSAAPEAATNGEKSKKKKAKTAAPVEAATTFPELNEGSKEASRRYLLSAAGALLKRPDDFAAFCKTVYGIEPATVGVAMTGEIQERVLEACEQLQQLLAAFDAASSTKKKEKSDAVAASRARQGLAVLLSVSLLQLYHEPRADAIEVLDDIQACGEKLTAALARSKSEGKQGKQGKQGKHGKQEKNGKSGKKSQKDIDEEDDGHKGHEHGEPDIGQVLTEVLLALLAESSQLTRQTSLQVFEAFTPFMSAEALDNLTDVLAAEENTSGYRALFNQEGEDEEEDNEDDEDDDDDSVEMMDMDADGDVAALAEAVGSGDEEEEESEDESESDEEEEDEEEQDDEDKTKDGEPNSLEEALMKTYKGSLLVNGKDGKEANDGDDDDDDSDNESDMSDDAMLRLDEHLASHLKLIRNKTDNHKKERDEARKRVVGFKHRVLDLVETYVKKAPTATGASLLLLFRLLLPLVVLIRDTKDPSLAQKATRIVQEVPKQLKKGRSSTPSKASSFIPLAEALVILESLHEAANDPTENRAAAAALSTASVAIATALWTTATTRSTEEDSSDAESDDDDDVETYDRATAYRAVADIYRATQDRWILEGWSVRTSLFTDWLNWCQNAARGA